MLGNITLLAVNVKVLLHTLVISNFVLSNVRSETPFSPSVYVTLL